MGWGERRREEPRPYVVRGSDHVRGRAGGPRRTPAPRMHSRLLYYCTGRRRGAQRQARAPGTGHVRLERDTPRWPWHVKRLGHVARRRGGRYGEEEEEEEGRKVSWIRGRGPAGGRKRIIHQWRESVRTAQLGSYSSVGRSSGGLLPGWRHGDRPAGRRGVTTTSRGPAASRHALTD